MAVYISRARVPIVRDSSFLYCATDRIKDTPCKLLIRDKQNRLIPCNYQGWYVSDEHSGGSGNDYVPVEGCVIDPSQLRKIDSACALESKTREGEDFVDFVRRLMNHPRDGAQFVMFDGVEQVPLPQEHYRFLWMKFTKQREVKYVHHFSLYRLAAPFDSDFEKCLAQKRADVIRKHDDLKQLMKEMSFLSITDYCAIHGYGVRDFDVKVIEHAIEIVIGSGYALPPISGLTDEAKKEFVALAPQGTTGIVAVQVETTEVPSTFFERGKQRVAFRGVALVVKTK